MTTVESSSEWNRCVADDCARLTVPAMWRRDATAAARSARARAVRRTGSAALPLLRSPDRDGRRRSSSENSEKQQKKTQSPWTIVLRPRSRMIRKRHYWIRSFFFFFALSRLPPSTGFRCYCFFFFFYVYINLRVKIPPTGILITRREEDVTPVKKNNDNEKIAHPDGLMNASGRRVRFAQGYTPLRNAVARLSRPNGDASYPWIFAF